MSTFVCERQGYLQCLRYLTQFCRRLSCMSLLLVRRVFFSHIFCLFQSPSKRLAQVVRKQKLLATLWQCDISHFYKLHKTYEIAVPIFKTKHLVKHIVNVWQPLWKYILSLLVELSLLSLLQIANTTKSAKTAVVEYNIDLSVSPNMMRSSQPR